MEGRHNWLEYYTKTHGHGPVHMRIDMFPFVKGTTYEVLSQYSRRLLVFKGKETKRHEREGDELFYVFTNMEPPNEEIKFEGHVTDYVFTEVVRKANAAVAVVEAKPSAHAAAASAAMAASAAQAAQAAQAPAAAAQAAAQRSRSRSRSRSRGRNGTRKSPPMSLRGAVPKAKGKTPFGSQFGKK